MTTEVGEAPRWSRLGVLKSKCDNIVGSIQHVLPLLGKYSDLIGWTQGTPCYEPQAGRETHLCMFHDMLTLRHLEHPDPFGTTEEILSSLASAGIDYFCGAWRDKVLQGDRTYDRAGGRRTFNWEGEMRITLGALAIARRREELLQVAAFVDRDLPLDDDLYERTKVDCMFLEVLAWRLLHADFAGCQDLVESIRKGRGRRARAMLECLEAIDSGAPNKIRMSLLQVVKLYRSAEFDPKRYKFAVSVDATLLWNIAQMWASVPTDLPQDVMDHIITRTSLGLDAPGDGESAGGG